MSQKIMGYCMMYNLQKIDKFIQVLFKNNNKIQFKILLHFRILDLTNPPSNNSSNYSKILPNNIKACKLITPENKTIVMSLKKKIKLQKITKL